MLPDHDERLARARLSLEGLSVGDALGERFFGAPDVVRERVAARALPEAAVWRWTDDTAMAVSVVEELAAHGEIDRDALARRFARAFERDPRRGYGGGTQATLGHIVNGYDWDVAARVAHDGRGSMGNGAAMRSAPVGAYFADDAPLAAGMAALSADPTHAHPDARAGAAAVAVAAALAASSDLAGRAFLDAVVLGTPEGPTREGIVRARDASFASVEDAADSLGSGRDALCSDTVPFALWCASRHLGDFEEAIWATLAGLGDRDTTCAIVGGIVVLRVGEGGLPTEWRRRREPLPR